MGAIIGRMKTYIYGLKDPRDGKFYYVGRTNNPQRRNWEHRATLKHTYSAWHLKMHADGIKPVMEILEVTGGNGFFHEIKWMKLLRQQGHPLVNVKQRSVGPHSLRVFDPPKSEEEVRIEKTKRIQAAWRKWWDSLSAEEKSRRQRAKTNEKSKKAGRDYWMKMTPEQRMKKHKERWARMSEDAKKRVLEGYKVRDAC
jgi:hypothetical protein